MNKPFSAPVRLDLRQRMIEDMTVRGFSAQTQHDYLRVVTRFAALLARKQTGGFREEFRTPAGVRKSPKNEPAGMRL